MPRKPRHEEAGAVHHVYARGVERRVIFLIEDDWEVYLDTLAFVVRGWRWRCLAYCLMPNHVHLLIETEEPNLGLGMQRLHGLYAQTFNNRHGRLGHLFQDRYGSSRIRSYGRLEHVREYIALNPVNAGLCAKPAEWRWSSSAIPSDAKPAWLEPHRVPDFGDD